MLLAPEVERFVAWFAALQGRIEALVREICTPMVVDVGAAARGEGPRRPPTAEHEQAAPDGDASSRPARDDGTPADWGQWLDANAHPELEGLREWTARARA